VTEAKVQQDHRSKSPSQSFIKDCRAFAA
jgi:hypothetical protein